MDRVKKVCSVCGSDDVLVDAYAKWDVDIQHWVLDGAFAEDVYCAQCDEKTGLKDEEIE